MPTLQFTRRYSMAHRLISDPHSKCMVPHGHNEFVRVRLEPLARFTFGAANMIAPFDALKRRWHGWIDGRVDHCLMLNANDPLLGYFKANEPQRVERIMTFAGDPTTEALAACFWLKLSAFIAADDLPVRVSEISVEETPTNTVILTPATFDAETCGLSRGAWPWRADMSINDLA
jgi:6-pyruvoyltetrahydropterin/6-carboxytetrahydropterin synthase